MSVHSIAQFIPLSAVTIVDNVRTKTGLDRSSLEELAESIKMHGVLQPIIVGKVGDGYAVIAGQRRTLAAKLAGLDAIQAIVTDGTEEGDALKAVQIVENLHRENLSLSETCGAVRDMLAMVGKPAEVAKRLNKSSAWVSKHLSITGPNFDQSVRNLVADGQCQDLELALTLNQIAKHPNGDAIAGKLIAEVKTGLIGRAKVRAELEKLKGPKAEAEKGGDEGQADEEGGDEATKGKQTITVDLSADLAAMYEALGGATWLRKQLKKALNAQGQLPV